MDFDIEHKTLNVGSDDTFEICKIYGPTVMCDLRITINTLDCQYMIEKQIITQDKDGNDIIHWDCVSLIDANLKKEG